MARRKWLRMKQPLFFTAKGKFKLVARRLKCLSVPRDYVEKQRYLSGTDEVNLIYTMGTLLNVLV